MTQANLDSDLLLSKTVNQSLALATQHQALKIALYDEYHARAVYSKVLETFGAVLPFVNIVEAENRHIAELLVLFKKYGVEPVVDDWMGNVNIELTLLQNCEIGVAAEIENIKMYDGLIPYAETPDVLDAFYRLQAASFNNHLPAFRQCIASAYTQPQQPTTNQQDLLDSVKGLIGGNPNIGALQSMFQGMGTEFIVGAAAGAVIMGLVSGGSISELLNPTNKGE